MMGRRMKLIKEAVVFKLWDGETLLYLFDFSQGIGVGFLREYGRRSCLFLARFPSWLTASSNSPEVLNSPTRWRCLRVTLSIVAWQHRRDLVFSHGYCLESCH